MNRKFIKMAKFLAYYNLFPTNIGVEFLGLSRDAEKGSIINTLGRNMVIITKVSKFVYKINMYRHENCMFFKYSLLIKNKLKAGHFWSD